MDQGSLNFILALVIVIVAAKMGGYISTRFRQPSVLGELLAGLILGPTVLDMLHAWPVFSDSETLGESLTLMAEMGVLLLMLLAGLDLHLDEMVKSGKVSAFAGVLGVVVPMGLGYGTAVLFDASSVEALFLALTLAATSISISVQTLMELEVLRSRVGLGLLGAAFFDDILVILVLSVSTVFVGSAAGGFGAVLSTITGMVLYLLLASALGYWLVPRVASMIRELPISQSTVAFVLVACLLYAWAAEVLGGMAAITGAFLVGLFLARTEFREQIEQGISVMAYGLFVPIFFVNIGLDVNMRAVGGDLLWFALTITAIAIVSKILGSGGGALLGGMKPRESFQLGIGMVARGEVGLIVASFALSHGVLSQEEFSIAVFMIITAALVTPPMLRAAFAREQEEPEAETEPLSEAAGQAGSQIGEG